MAGSGASEALGHQDWVEATLLHTCAAEGRLRKAGLVRASLRRKGLHCDTYTRAVRRGGEAEMNSCCDVLEEAMCCLD
jgi:hypothetical protein